MSDLPIPVSPQSNSSQNFEVLLEHANIGVVRLNLQGHVQIAKLAFAEHAWLRFG